MNNPPYFIQDRTVLLEMLRITDHSDDTARIIDDAISGAKVWMLDRIGIERASAIRDVVPSEQPETRDQMRRYKAERLEHLLVRRTLMRTLPQFFASGTGGAQAAWNQEGVLRDSLSQSRDREAQITSEINSLVRDLTNSGEAMNAFNVGPECPNRAPGSHLWSGPGHDVTTTRTGTGGGLG